MLIARDTPRTAEYPMGQWRRGITVLIYCWILCVALGRAALVDATLLQIEARSDCPVIQLNWFRFHLLGSRSFERSPKSGG